MVEQHPKPSYSTIMRELDIPIISPNNNPLYDSKQKQIQKDRKTGIKLKNLRGLEFIDSCAYFLRFQYPYFFLSIISHKRKKGVFYS